MNPQRVYNVLFPGKIPPTLESRFLDAWQVLAADYTEDERQEFEHVLTLGQDLEAIELVGRRRKQLPMLVDQVRLMCVLAETRPDHARYFFQTTNSRLLGLFAMAWAGARGIVKYFQGIYLLRRISKRERHHCG
jgi:hypothetical protein